MSVDCGCESVVVRVYTTGQPGDAASLTAGTAYTIPYGSTPEIVIDGTAPSQTISLGIPQGPPGVQGGQGPSGETGSLVSAASLATWTPRAGGKQLLTDGTRYDSFPVATAKDDGTLVVAWSSNAVHAGDGYVMTRYSIDQGATWSIPQMVGGDPADGRSQIVALSSMRDRTAMMTFTDGAPARTGWVWVTDNPAVWPTTPIKVDWGTTGSVFPSSLVWLDDHTLDGVMLATEYGTDGVLITRSVDAGQTWEQISNPLPPGQGYNETAISRTATGDLVMLARNNGAADRIDMLRSYDNGVTWTIPKVAVSTASGMPKVTLMPDGTLIGTIRDEAQSDGRWTLIVSVDDGHHWSRTPVNDEWMMYGQVIPLINGNALLVGSNQNRSAQDQAWVWTIPVTTDSGWIDAPMQVTSPDARVLQYRLDGNQVKWRGFCTMTSGYVAATWVQVAGPIPFAPKQSEGFNASTSQNTLAGWDMRNNGTLWFRSVTAGTNGYISASQIGYYID